MVKSNTSSPFFSYVFCMMAYFVSVFANEISIKEFMHLSDISFTEYDQIIFSKLLGRLTAAVILLLFVKRFSFKRIIVCSVFLYFLSVFNIIFMDVPHEIMLLYFFIYTSTTIVVSTLLLGYILIDNKIDDNYSLAIYVVSIFTAYLVVDTFEYFTITGVYYLSELMGTSFTQRKNHYGHLLTWDTRHNLLERQSAHMERYSSAKLGVVRELKRD